MKSYTDTYSPYNQLKSSMEDALKKLNALQTTIKEREDYINQLELTIQQKENEIVQKTDLCNVLKSKNEEEQLKSEETIQKLKQ